MAPCARSGISFVVTVFGAGSLSGVVLAEHSAGPALGDPAIVLERPESSPTPVQGHHFLLVIRRSMSWWSFPSAMREFTRVIILTRPKSAPSLGRTVLEIAAASLLDPSCHVELVHNLGEERVGSDTAI